MAITNIYNNLYQNKEKTATHCRHNHCSNSPSPFKILWGYQPYKEMMIYKEFKKYIFKKQKIQAQNLNQE